MLCPLHPRIGPDNLTVSRQSCLCLLTTLCILQSTTLRLLVKLLCAPETAYPAPAHKPEFYHTPLSCQGNEHLGAQGLSILASQLLLSIFEQQRTQDFGLSLHKVSPVGRYFVEQSAKPSCDAVSILIDAVTTRLD